MSVDLSMYAAPLDSEPMFRIRTEKAAWLRAIEHRPAYAGSTGTSAPSSSNASSTVYNGGGDRTALPFTVLAAGDGPAAAVRQRGSGGLFWPWRYALAALRRIGVTNIALRPSHAPRSSLPGVACTIPRHD